MPKTQILRRGMAAWAEEPPFMVKDETLALMTVQEVLWGLRTEYRPSMLPIPDMYEAGKLVQARAYDTFGRFHYTIRGWMASLLNRRSLASAINDSHVALEKAFLELYPPFGLYTPPSSWIPWVPGTVKSSSRLPTVEYSLTSVFDSKILPSKGGWAAFHRLISAAEARFTKKSKKAAMRAIWKGVRDEEEAAKLSKKKLYYTYHSLNVI